MLPNHKRPVNRRDGPPRRRAAPQTKPRTNLFDHETEIAFDDRAFQASQGQANSDWQAATQTTVNAWREENVGVPLEEVARLGRINTDVLRAVGTSQGDGDGDIDMAGEAPKPTFSFGQPAASSSGQSGSLFGTAGAQQNKPSLFGGSATPNSNQGGGTLFGGGQATGASPFGSGTNTPSVSGQNPFGATPSTTGQQKSLFGSATPASSAPSLFSSNAASSGQQSKPLFGAVTSGGEQKSTFGSTAGTSSVFGGGNAGGNQSSGFSFGQQKPATSTPGTSAPASQPASGPSLFGGQNTTASPAVTPGEQPKSSAAGGMFSTPATTAGGSGGGLFGSSTTTGSGWNFANANTPASTAAEQSNTTASSIFSQGTTPAAKPASTGLFGASATPGGAATPQTNKTAAPVSFTPAGNPPTNLFGAQNASKPNENQAPANQQSSNLFGAKPAAQDLTTNKPFSFTNTSNQPSSTQQPSGSSIFAKPTTETQPSTTAQPSGSNLFSGGFKPAAPATTSAPPASSGTTGSNLFAGLGSGTGAAASSASSQPATTSTAAPAFTGFSLGGQGASAASSQPATTSSAAPAAGGASLFGAAPASSAAGSSGNLFGGASGAQPSSTTAAPTTTSAGSAGGLFGASTSKPTTTTATTTGATTSSTSGPAPPQQHRLANKSMDEILTMWSTSLATHQKTFQQLASRVSTWDRMLVENSSKISMLYGRCFQAERDCSEVERQLTNVENSQSELEGLLERYERDVDAMMESSGMGEGGGGVGGVDAERERTYKTAEACSTRLTEMGHSLTDMIEEINAASTKLGGSHASSSSAAADDPLSEIVRVLNSHLAMLQGIDAGAASLQGKVGAAQREARRLGEGQALNGGPGAWVAQHTTCSLSNSTTSQDNTESNMATVDSETANSEQDTCSAGDTCYFFNIPPELRNEIYELAFTSPEGQGCFAKTEIDPRTDNTALPGRQPDSEHHDGVDIMTAEPPSKALISVCKQAYQEARDLYRAAYRRYWSRTKFCLDLREGLAPARARLEEIGDQEITAMTRFTLICRDDCYNRHIDLINGGWAASVERKREGALKLERFNFFVVMPKGRDIRPADFEVYHATNFSYLRLPKDAPDSMIQLAVRQSGRSCLTRCELMAIVKGCI